MRQACILAVAIAVLLIAATTQADEASEAIVRAGQAYAGGDYRETSTQLQTALVHVNQKLIDMLMEHLPAPPAGWTAEDPEGVDASMIGAGFFASFVVTRQYHPPGGSTIELVISANSPLLATLRMFISNPMLATMTGQTGMQRTEICGYEAVEHFDTETDTYETNILAGNSTLIGVSGQQSSDEPHVRTMAGMVDCQGIVGIIE
jgi:hypothetical protein